MRAAVKLRGSYIVGHSPAGADRHFALPGGIPSDAEARAKVVVIGIPVDAVDQGVLAVRDAAGELSAALKDYVGQSRGLFDPPESFPAQTPGDCQIGLHLPVVLNKYAGDLL